MKTTRLLIFLTSALSPWAMNPTVAFAQGCCQQGAAGGNPSGGHAGHQSSPMSMGLPGGQSAHERGAGGACPMCFGSACSESQRPEAATDIIKWPKLLREPAFASRRDQIEAPYRRSPPDSSTPTPSDYRNMVKSVEEMKAIVAWFTTTGVDTHDYEEAKAFLNKLDVEARTRFEIASRATPASAQAAVASKPKPIVSLAKLDQSYQAAIARQKVCPVTGAKLGSMGDPIKVLVGGHPLYLCCAGCVAKVKQSPDKYAVQ